MLHHGRRIRELPHLQYSRIEVICISVGKALARGGFLRSASDVDQVREGSGDYAVGSVLGMLEFLRDFSEFL